MSKAKLKTLSKAKLKTLSKAKLKTLSKAKLKTLSKAKLNVTRKTEVGWGKLEICNRKREFKLTFHFLISPAKRDTALQDNLHYDFPISFNYFLRDRAAI